MTIYRAALFSSLVFVLTACLGAGILPERFNWCYAYDFTTSNYGFNITAGEWVSGAGLLTDNSGNLQFSYDIGKFVGQTGTSVYVARVAGSTNDINATAAGQIYGISANFTQTLPGTMADAQLDFVPTNAGDAGTRINVSMQADDYLYITKIQIIGDGSNPFSISNCGGIATPTVTQTSVVATNTPGPSLTPSLTLSPTNTPTATPTFTPTATTTATATTPFMCEWDFTASAGNFTQGQNDSERAQYVSGSGWRRGTKSARLEIMTTFNLTATINSVETRYSRMYSLQIGGSSFYWNYPGSTLVFVANAPDLVQNYTSTTPLTISNQRFLVGISNNNTPSNGITPAFPSDLYVTYLKITGTGTKPAVSACVDASPTSTPTAQVLTPNPLTQTPLPTVTPRITRTPLPPVSSPTVSVTPMPMTATGSPSPGPTMTPFELGSLIATMTAEWSTRVSGSSTPGATPSDSESLESIASTTNDIFSVLTSFFGWIEGIFGQLFAFLAGIFGWIAATIQNFFDFLSNLLAGIIALIETVFRFLVELLEIIGLVIQLVLATVGLMFRWLLSLVSLLTNLITTFFTVSASPIPGVPLCITDPASYDICAIYYVLDWTLFAPNTPGAFITPLIMSMIGIVIIMRFAKTKFEFVKIGSAGGC